jgi:hypothetical protein
LRRNSRFAITIKAALTSVGQIQLFLGASNAHITKAAFFFQGSGVIY